jgi:signal transduction histidine kinase
MPEQHPDGSTAEDSALADFADEVAHDLRNTLNNLNLNIQYLDMTLDQTNPAVGRALQRMRDEMARLRQLVEELPARARSTDPG